MKFWTSAACPAARQSKGFGELSGELTVRRIIAEMVEPGPLGVPGPGRALVSNFFSNTTWNNGALENVNKNLFERHIGHVIHSGAMYSSKFLSLHPPKPNFG